MAARLFKALEQSRKVAGPSASNAVTSIAAAAAPLMHLALSSRQRQTPGYTTDTLSSPATMSSQSEVLSVPLAPSSSATHAPGGRAGEGDKGNRMDFKPLLQEWYGRSFASAPGAPAAAGGGGSPPPRWSVGQESGGGAGGFPAPCFVPGGRGRASAIAALQFLEELSKRASSPILAKPEPNQDQDQDQDQNRNQQQLLVSQGLPFAVSNPPWLPPATSSDSFESPLGSALVTPRKVLGAPQMYPRYGAEGSPGAEVHCSFPGALAANQQPPSLQHSSYHGSPRGFPLDESNAANEQETHHHQYFQQADVVTYQQMVPGSGGIHEPLSEKKMRRLLSNRASAKRSRKRRQDRLEELEIVTARLRVEQAETQHSLVTARAEVRKLQDQNEELKKEINRLQVAGGTPRATEGTLEGLTTRSKIGSKQHSCCSPDAALDESLTDETETPKHADLKIEAEDGVPPKKRSKPESSLHIQAESQKPLVQPDSNRGQKVFDLNEFLVYIGCEEMVHVC